MKNGFRLFILVMIKFDPHCGPLHPYRGVKELWWCFGKILKLPIAAIHTSSDPVGSLWFYQNTYVPKLIGARTLPALRREQT